MSRIEKLKREAINEANRRVLNEQEETIVVDVSDQGLGAISHLQSFTEGFPATMKNETVFINDNNKKYLVNLSNIKNISQFKNMAVKMGALGKNSEIFEYLDDYNIKLSYNRDGRTGGSWDLTEAMNNNDELFLQLDDGAQETALCFRNKAGQFTLLWLQVYNKTTNESLKLKIKDSEI